MPEATADLYGTEALRLLLVEDNRADAHLVREYLKEAGVAATLRVEETLAAARTAIDADDWGIILLDLNLPDSAGLDTLDAILSCEGDVPVIVLTGLGDEEMGTAALRAGAQDFLPKDEITGPLLRRAIRHAIERKRHEREALKAENRAQQYLDIVELLLVGLDPDGRITLINQTGAELLGYDEPAEVEGRIWFDLALPPGDREGFKDLHRALLSGDEELTHYEIPIVTRAGVERMVAWKTSVLHDERGEATGTLSSGLDVSQRRASEKKLQLLNEALQSTHDAIIITDLEARIEWANPAFTEMTGYTLPEALGRTPEELVQSGEHDDAFYRDLWETILDGKVWEGRIVNRRKDGTLYPEHQSITPVRDASGTIAHFVAVKRDVTKEVRYEEEILRANRALRVISGGNQALLRSSDETEILDEVCRVALEDGGYRFASIGYVDEGDPDRIRPVAHRGEGSGYLQDIDFRLEGDERDTIPAARAILRQEPVVVRGIEREATSEWKRAAVDRGFRSKVALPLTMDGDCFGALCIYSEDPDAFDEREMRILTELSEDLAHGIATHRTRDRKEELEKQLQRAEKLRAVGQLAGGVAHDFNNYLTVITTLTDLVLQDSDLSEESRTELDEVREAARSSARLTRQLLAFSRQDVVRLQVVDLNEEIQATCSMLDRMLKETIQLELEPCDGLLPVKVDPGQLEQVMMNLAVNARDAMPGGGTLTIGTGLEEFTGPREPPDEALEPGRYVVLYVHDTGTGISEGDLPRIFEPFFTSKESGTGLGLSTVYGVVTHFGGAIQVHSEVGEGTEFQIYLPLADEEELSDGPDREPTRETVEGTETILVVEDQEHVRRAVRRILERAGHNVLECGSVVEAKEVSDATDVEIDLLLTDLGLPDGNGREVATAFLDARPGLPVIYTSGYTPDDLTTSLSLGPHEHFIEKPFDVESLSTLVRRTLDGFYAEREEGG